MAEHERLYRLRIYDYSCSNSGLIQKYLCMRKQVFWTYNFLNIGNPRSFRKWLLKDLLDHLCVNPSEIKNLRVQNDEQPPFPVRLVSKLVRAPSNLFLRPAVRDTGKSQGYICTKIDHHVHHVYAFTVLRRLECVPVVTQGKF